MSAIITLDQLKETAPSVFATSPSNKVSDRYSFVPTFELLEKFMDEGWVISSANQMGKSLHGRHQIRLRNGELPKVGDTLVEAIINNSHNGTSLFSVSAGLHRLVCSNGLTVPTSVSEAFKLRHTSIDGGEVRKFTEEFAERLPMIEASVDKMMNKNVSNVEKESFVKSAAGIRWKMGQMPTGLTLEQVLEPLRDGDKGNDMWSLFNVVQEKFVRGGLKYQSNKRSTSMKELRSINSLQKVNTELWELADSYC